MGFKTQMQYKPIRFCLNTQVQSLYFCILNWPLNVFKLKFNTNPHKILLEHKFRGQWHIHIFCLPSASFWYWVFDHDDRAHQVVSYKRKLKEFYFYWIFSSSQINKYCTWHMYNKPIPKMSRQNTTELL